MRAHVKVDKMGLVSRLVHLHWWLVLLVTLLACAGFTMTYSAANGDIDRWMLPQIKRFIMFFFVMIGIALTPTRYILKISYVAYISAFLLLVAVEVAGETNMGATRWISIGGFSMQPAELMKLALVLGLARYFHCMHYKDVSNVLYLIVPILMALLPAALVLIQPDLGTAFIVLMTGGAVFFAAGVKAWKFVVVIIIGLAAIPVAWHELHDYQRQRVLTFLSPETDPLGAGYNILQSQIAIGSGGFTGKGYMAGSQNQLSFLPEKHTDFIFTMLSEEFGFIGSVSIVVIFSLIIVYGTFIAINCRNQYGRLLAIGITTMVFLHAAINMAMVMGMVPVVGVPLPLVSYGGTMLMVVLIGTGLLLNIHLYYDVKLERNQQGPF
ncbi:MAG: rod shape-determining protein RodA [Rickettsiales bacterium]|jgi:rod shape determining protein RodA|nr:rod shape-determining protein RodA [Rickettsiales bacterium]